MGTGRVVIYTVTISRTYWALSVQTLCFVLLIPGYQGNICLSSLNVSQ